MARFSIAAPAALCLLVACASAPTKSKPPVGKTAKSHVDERTLEGPPGLSAAAMATVDKADAPVAVASNASGGLLAFVKDGSVMVRAFSKGPSAAAEAVPVAKVGTLGAAFSIRPRKDGSFILFWDEKIDQNHVFKLQRVGADGKPNGKTLALAPVADSGVSYADVATVGDRVLVVHEVEKAERQSVFVTPIAAAFDKQEGPARPVLEGALAWYPTETADGLALLVVKGDASGEDASAQRGSLDLVLVDSAGKVSTPKPLLTAPTATIDAQIVAVKGGFVAAWTDEDHEDGAVRVITLGRDGTPKGSPAWIAPPIGAQAFVSLSADPSGEGERALVAWENVGQTSGTSRIMNLATVSATGVSSPARTRLLYDDSDRPAIVADGEGFAALTLAPARASSAAETDKAPSLPTIVRLGADLSLRWSEPVRFVDAAAKDGVPDTAWGLSCHGSSCFVVATDGPGPTSVFVVSTADRESAWKAPAWRADDEKPPKVLSLRTVTQGARIAGAQATPRAVAWVTYFLEGTTPAEAPAKGEAPYAATLGLRFGNDSATPIVVSRRAVSLGGVSLAIPDESKQEAVLAWVGAEKQGPQVFVTKMGADGKKIAQKKVTTVARDKKSSPPKEGGGKGKGKKGAPAEPPPIQSSALGASSVAIATSPGVKGAKGEGGSKDGFVLAWVDTRDKNGEVYVARLAQNLDKTVSDKRVTTAAGDASDLTLMVRGGDAFLAFADARDGKPEDIFFCHLEAGSLKKIDDAGRVYASAGRSRAPRIASLGSKIVLAWIEEPATADGRATMRIAEVDASGRLAQPPRVIEAPGRGSVRAFTLTCDAGGAGCKLALSWTTEDGRTEVGASTVDASLAVAPITRLGGLASGPFADPSFTFGDGAGKALFYAEDLGESGRLRQLELSW